VTMQEVEGLDAPTLSPLETHKQLHVEEAWLADMIQVRAM